MITKFVTTEQFEWSTKSIKSDTVKFQLCWLFVNLHDFSSLKWCLLEMLYDGKTYQNDTE